MATVVLPARLLSIKTLGRHVQEAMMATTLMQSDPLGSPSEPPYDPLAPQPEPAGLPLPTAPPLPGSPQSEGQPTADADADADAGAADPASSGAGDPTLPPVPPDAALPPQEETAAP